MDPRWKKLGLLIALIAITGGIGYGIYRVFFAPKETTPPLATNGTAINGLPNAGNGSQTGSDVTPPGSLNGANDRPGGSIVTPGIGSAINPIDTSTPSRSAVIRTTPVTQISGTGIANGAIRSYSPTDGKFYKIFEDGSTIPLSNKVFNSVKEANWANQNDRAVLTFPDGTKILYDFATDQQKTLPRYWDGFAFSPDDSQLVTKSVGNDPSNRFLIVANPDSGEQKIIEDLGENQDKVHVAWSPNNQVIAYAFTGAPIGQDEQAVVLVGQNHENFKNLIVDGRGFTPVWSPSGNAVIYSVWNADSGYRPQLWFSRADGDNINAGRLDLGLQTWGDKCAWQAEDTVICAVPLTTPEGAGLQRASLDNGPDVIYRIDLKTGLKTSLGMPGQEGMTVENITAVSGSKVFFTDKRTGKLISFDTR